ncbi:MAG: inositol monophosphatase family protein [Ancrocorticia sp.]
MTDSIALADIAEHAARSVSDYLVRAFRSPGNVKYKADFHDVVTVHDTEAQRRIVEVILAQAPDSLIVGEESAELISADGTVREAGDDDVLWYVDPIDGTSNFAIGFDHWCVSIAAARHGEVIAAVIYQPTAGILYRADETGAYCNGERMRVSQAPIAQGVFSTSFPSARGGDEAAALGFLRLVRETRSVRRPGSTALSLADVAAGHFLATFNMDTNPWDVAAGILLVQRAGGIYLGFDDVDNPSTPTDGTRLYTRDLALATNYAAGGTPEAAAFCLEIMGRADLAESARRASAAAGNGASAATAKAASAATSNETTSEDSDD